MGKETLYFKDCVGIFVKFYNARYDRRYVFTPKDGVHLKNILRRLQLLCEDKGVAFDKAQALAAFAAYIEMAFRDEWLRAHYELPVLSAKFNAIAGWVSAAAAWQNRWRRVQEDAASCYFLEGGAPGDEELAFGGETWQTCCRIAAKEAQKQPKSLQSYLQSLINNPEHWTLR